MEKREIDQLALPDEERRTTIVRILADCRVLLVEKVGEAPKKLLADAGVDAIDKFKGRDIEGARRNSPRNIFDQRRDECRFSDKRGLSHRLYAIFLIDFSWARRNSTMVKS